MVKKGTGFRMRVEDHSKTAHIQIEKPMRLKLKLAALMYADQVKKNISKSARSSGHSKAGQFPHLDTGKLRQSIQVGTVKNNSVQIGAHVDYAKALELGTSKMAARPFLRPTLNMMRKQIVKIIKR